MDLLRAETERVTQHLARAAHHAAQRTTAGLGHVQRIVRQLLLGALAEYRAAGRFPINRDFAERTPTFVDDSGTRCAMAHLLELGGEGALVERIARERNHAWIRELVDEPQLRAWLAAAGLSAGEAAAIQPAYCSLVTDCVCGGDFSSIDYPVPALGVLEGVVLASGKARVERTYGDALGFDAGSEIALATSYPEGTRIVAPVDGAKRASFGSIALDSDTLYHCQSQGVSSAPALDAGQFAQAVLASNCAANLEALDAAWRRQQDCSEPEPGPGDGGGCSASAEAASIGVLLALVGALVHRSRSARARAA